MTMLLTFVVTAFAFEVVVLVGYGLVKAWEEKRR